MAAGTRGLGQVTPGFMLLQAQAQAWAPGSWGQPSPSNSGS